MKNKKKREKRVLHKKVHLNKIIRKHSKNSKKVDSKKDLSKHQKHKEILNKKPKGSELHKYIINNLDNDNNKEKVKNLILDALKRGYSKEEIKKRFIENKWPEKIIDNIFNDLDLNKKDANKDSIIAKINKDNMVGKTSKDSIIAKINKDNKGVLKKDLIKDFSKKLKINYKYLLIIVGIILVLVLGYFLYQIRTDIVKLSSEKDILYYILGGIIVGTVLIVIIKLTKKSNMPKFDVKKDIPKDLNKIENKNENKIDVSKVIKDNKQLNKYETYFDQLYDLINEKESIDIDQVMKIFNINRENAERWGKILEGHGLIKLYYHGLNKISFKKW